MSTVVRHRIGSIRDADLLLPRLLVLVLLVLLVLLPRLLVLLVLLTAVRRQHRLQLRLESAHVGQRERHRIQRLCSLIHLQR